MKNDKKAHGWKFTVEVNHPFSHQFSRTEALTHQSVLWDLKLAVHAIDGYGMSRHLRAQHFVGLVKLYSDIIDVLMKIHYTPEP